MRGMDMCWKIIATLSLDCFKGSPSSSHSSILPTGEYSGFGKKFRALSPPPGQHAKSSTKLGSSQAASMESSSLTGSLSLGSDVPHCQCCITYEARLKRLSCGHLYCDPCSDQIVNLAFEDIEGLAEYPCPMCKTLRHLGGFVPAHSFHCSPFESQKQQLVEACGKDCVI